MPTGVALSRHLESWASIARPANWSAPNAKRLELRLQNCQFQTDNVLELSHADETFDALVAARLFTVIPDHEHALSEMYRILRPGGRCFVAEPRYAIWASLPLLAMWLLAGITGMNNGCREPGTRHRPLQRGL